MFRKRIHTEVVPAERPATRWFFEPGQAYKLNRPRYTPEVVTAFQCLAVIEHRGELLAFGLWRGTHSDAWRYHALDAGEWERGWLSTGKTLVYTLAEALNQALDVPADTIRIMP